MTKPLKILLTEDNEKHLADAKDEIQNRTDSGLIIDPTIIRDYASFLNIEDKNFDGVVSDIFFPSNIDKPYDTLANNFVWDIFGKEYAEEHGDWYRCGIEFREKIHKLVVDGWMDGEETPPSGIIIADYAIENDIPVVFCTDTYHHGYKTQPVFEYAQENGIPVIDASPENREGHSQTKDWKKAFDTLMGKIK